MAKRIFKFLSPVLTILGLFIILVVLSSSDDNTRIQGCCGDKSVPDLVTQKIIWFNKGETPMNAEINYGKNRPLLIEPGGIKDSNQDFFFPYNPGGGMEQDVTFKVDVEGIGLRSVTIKTTLDKTYKLNFLVVWDGTTLKAAQ